jgi:hypothetical protein
LTEIAMHRGAASPPRGVSYLRFAAIAIAILGATIGTAHAGSVRWITWVITAVVVAPMFAIGERGVRRWKTDFAAKASPDLLLENRLLHIVNRAELIVAAITIAGFVLVLFIPVSLENRWRIYLAYVVGLSGVIQLLQRRHK